jgi:CBS domain-containing protein
MKLKAIMTRDVQLVGPNDSLSDVAQKMKEEDTGALPICDGEKIQGMITDRDIVIRVLAEGKNLNDLKASDVMSKHVHYCLEDDDILEAAKLMQRKQVRRLVVLNEAHKLVGLVSLGDIAMHIGPGEVVGRTLKKISAPNSAQSYYKELKKTPQGATPWDIFRMLGGLSSLFALGYFLYRRREEKNQGLKDLFNRATKIKDRLAG